MLIPLRTNRPPRRRPLVTEAIIILNLLVYLGGLVGEAAGVVDREHVLSFGQLSWDAFEPWQLITYQFLHDQSAIWHLAFNMLFLWVFGCAVEDRMRRTSFLVFYLIGGAVAGFAHMAIDPQAPVIGASGSIAAVTGAFLALFPRSRIRILFFFFFIGIFEIPALWFIGFYFLLDILRQTSAFLGGGSAGVAYAAHIAGYLYGFGVAFALLALGIIKREEFDIFYLFKQSRRRAAFRAASRGDAAGPWTSASADTGERLSKRKKKSGAMTANEEALASGRAAITRLLEQHDVEKAAARYRTLLDRFPEATFPEPRQVDLANRLLVENDHVHAARAYELLLRTYPGCREAADVRLMLALVYARHLDRPADARRVLDGLEEKLREPAQTELLEQLQKELAA